MRTSAVIAGTIAVITSFAVVASIMLSGSGADEQRLVASQSFNLWGDTPRDWVGWADEIAVVNVVGEEQLGLDPRLLDGAEGEVGRRIEATVEHTIWSRTGVAGAPTTVRLRTDGWWFKNGRLTPMKELGSHRSEIGDRLLVAMFHSKGHGWTLMSGGIPVGDDARVRSDPDQADIGTHLDGMTLRQLTATFRSTKPHAEVARFAHLGVDARMRAVWEGASKSSG